MDEYKRPYTILWNGITYAIEAIEFMNYGTAEELLKKAQQNAEEAYIRGHHIRSVLTGRSGYDITKLQFKHRGAVIERLR